MRKILQNTFFAVMLAWALQGIQAHIEPSNNTAISINSGTSIPNVSTHMAWVR